MEEEFWDDELQLQLLVASTGHRDYCKEDSLLAVAAFDFGGFESF
jgi:hypothetical protein